jgi:hypothetical protein
VSFKKSLATSIPTSTNAKAPADISAFLPETARSGVTSSKRGVGGGVSVITNPRLPRLALLFRFQPIKSD